MIRSLERLSLQAGLSLFFLPCWLHGGVSIAAAGGASAQEKGWANRLDHGSFKGFPSYAEANELLDGWVRLFPDFIRKEQIGSSYEKRPIYAYVLASGGAHGSAANGLPQVLITSLMHPREPASLTVVLYMIGHLLELYSSGNADAVYVLEGRELWVVPFVNPDGYLANEKTPNTPVIRKNLRPTCRNRLQSGVDINRNFAIAWKRNAFPMCNEEYGGTAPFSEPETQALKQLCDRNSFKAALNFHTFGSMLTHPYNHAKTRKQAMLPVADDNAIYDEIRKAFKFYRFGPAISTVGYTAIGESDDWFYGAKGIISMSPEVGPESGGFFPSPLVVAGIDTRNFARIMYLVKKAGLELGASWKRADMDASGMSAAKVEAQGLPSGIATLVADKLSEEITPVSGLLELTLRNTGLSASFGSFLSVAVSGLGRIEEGASVIVATEGGDRLRETVSGSDDARIIAFQVPALPRRSRTRVWLILLGPWDFGEALELDLCVLEVAGVGTAQARNQGRVCQCRGAARLPTPEKDQATVSAGATSHSLVLNGTSAVAGNAQSAAINCAAAAQAAPPPANSFVATAEVMPSKVLPSAASLAIEQRPLDNHSSGPAGRGPSRPTRGLGLTVASLTAGMGVLALCILGWNVLRKVRDGPADAIPSKVAAAVSSSSSLGAVVDDEERVPVVRSSSNPSSNSGEENPPGPLVLGALSGQR